MRRPSTITLLFLGVILSACDDTPQPLHRDIYKTKEDCLRDWQQQANCEEQHSGTAQSAPPSTGSHHSTVIYPHYWMGPQYYSHGGSTAVLPNGSSFTRTAESPALGRTTIAPAAPSRHASSTGTMRGGFGSTGSSLHSSGGGS